LNTAVSIFELQFVQTKCKSDNIHDANSTNSERFLDLDIACADAIYSEFLFLQKQDSAIIEAFIHSQAHRERGEEYSDARKILQGDLIYDGSPETVVLYTIESQHGSVDWTF
jgi:hypothetical protein